MESLKTEGLHLDIEEMENTVFLRWKGISRHINPGSFLDPYLTKTLNNLKGKSLVMDFTQLETMNSSTMLPIIKFFKKLEDNKIESQIKYNNQLNWQKSSFLTLKIVTSQYTYVKIANDQ